MPESPGASPLRVAGQDKLVLVRSAELEAFYVLSPYVRHTGAGYEMLARLVNRDDDPLKKIARIHRATSTDGLRFTLDDVPVVAPGPDGSDDGGCEDPTVVFAEAGYEPRAGSWDAGHLSPGPIVETPAGRRYLRSYTE